MDEGELDNHYGDHYENEAYDGHNLADSNSKRAWMGMDSPGEDADPYDQQFRYSEMAGRPSSSQNHQEQHAH